MEDVMPVNVMVGVQIISNGKREGRKGPDLKVILPKNFPFARIARISDRKRVDLVGNIQDGIALIFNHEGSVRLEGKFNRTATFGGKGAGVSGYPLTKVKYVEARFYGRVLQIDPIAEGTFVPEVPKEKPVCHPEDLTQTTCPLEDLRTTGPSPAALPLAELWWEEDPRTSWTTRYMALARFWADSCSKDPSTKVGAVLVGKDRRDIALGYNGFPPGIEDTPERLDNRAIKYRLVQHAERNVLDNARFDTEGATLYVTLFPCCECAKSIISKGIKRVVAPSFGLGEARWYETMAASQAILEEAGVSIDFVERDPR